MTKKNIFAILFLFAIGLQTAWAQKFVVNTKDNQSTEYDLLQLNKISCIDSEPSKITIDLITNQSIEYNVSQLESINFADDETHGYTNSYEWVDLGLPSGTLWATCNIGANKPEEHGDYFAWGETEVKEKYGWNTYKHCNGYYTSMTKYTPDDALAELEPEDDAATINWSIGWQMPNAEQFDELINSNYTTTVWVTKNGVDGRLITSKSNGKSIFLPTTGYRSGTSTSSASSTGHYWSRTRPNDIDIRYGSYLYITSSTVTYKNNGSRYQGRPVRPVRIKETIHEYVDLGLPSGTLWATCNIGANSPEEYGGFFAWGETQPKEDYSWATYKYCNGVVFDDDDLNGSLIKTLTKYCTSSDRGYNGFIDNKTTLEPIDDAASINWGPGWETPNIYQYEELINNSYTTTTLTTINDVNGLLITSKSNGKSIFFPATGAYWDRTHYWTENDKGIYLTRSLRVDAYEGSSYNPRGCYANCIFFFGPTETNIYGVVDRRTGQTIRPVCVKRNLLPIPVTNIMISHMSLSLTVGETQKLTATIRPVNATNKGIVWSSSNTNVATVDQSGLVTTVAGGSCIIKCIATDGSGVMAECQVHVSDATHGITGGHRWVDLGLPSGTLWATCNVGANSPEEYGDYFAWGETEPKEDYGWATYKYCSNNNDHDDIIYITKYCVQNYYGPVDNKTELEAEDDAATVKWGSDWQIPSTEQQQELANNVYTTTKWTTQDGVNGILVTSEINGNSIFLPATGYYNGTDLLLEGSFGRFWSRSLYVNNLCVAFNMYVVSNNITAPWMSNRDSGLTIRPVRKQ